jgi:hypothetical protein
VFAFYLFFIFIFKKKGEAAAVRREHSKFLDFGPASVALIAPATYAEEYSNSKGKEHAIVFPLKQFLLMFARPRKLAHELSKRGEEVVSTWIAKNGGKDSQHKRSAVGRVYPIFTHEYTTRRGVPENS